MESVTFPTDETPTQHKILHVEDETNGRRKARTALKMAREELDGPLGVTRAPNPSITDEPLTRYVVGHREYAIYQLPVEADV